MKFTIMKTYEVERSYKVEADSKEQALRLANQHNFDELYMPTSSKRTKPEIVQVEDEEYDCEEWTPSYVKIYQCSHCRR